MANHVVLLGDSIFDNKAYVGRGPAVIDQLRGELPAGWKATLLAVDGSVTSDVPGQMARLPPDVSHLVVSVGGNDALRQSSILTRAAHSATEVFGGYPRAVRGGLLGHAGCRVGRERPTAVCTVYDGNMPDRMRQRLSSAGLVV